MLDPLCACAGFLPRPRFRRFVDGRCAKADSNILTGIAASYVRKIELRAPVDGHRGDALSHRYHAVHPQWAPALLSAESTAGIVSKNHVDRSTR
jgi:hypothetical protein